MSSLIARTLRVAPLVLGPALAAFALSVEPPDFSGLVASAAQVVHGRVISVESRKVETSQGPVIRTFIQVEVDSTIKGEAQRTVEFSQLGGEVDGVRLEVPGTPQFKAGEEDFFFLHGKRTAVSGLVRVGHGRYPVLQDPTTGRRYVARENRMPLTDPSEVALPLNALPPAAAKAAIPRALSPEAFAGHIATEVARTAAQSTTR